MTLNSFDPHVQIEKDGHLVDDFRQRIQRAKKKHGLTWWDFAALTSPPLSGSWLGNLTRYRELNVSTALANGLRDLITHLEDLEPGSPEFRKFLDRDKSLSIASSAETVSSPASTQMTIEDAIRTLRAAGFEVTLVAR